MSRRAGMRARPRTAAAKLGDAALLWGSLIAFIAIMAFSLAFSR